LTSGFVDVATAAGGSGIAESGSGMIGRSIGAGASPPSAGSDGVWVAIGMGCVSETFVVGESSGRVVVFGGIDGVGSARKAPRNSLERGIGPQGPRNAPGIAVWFKAALS
jgi:hypothetical protein